MSVWNQDRIPGQRGRHALGLWLPRRKLASAAWVPGLRARKPLYGKRYFALVFDYVLPANQTLERRFSVTSDYIWWGITISSSVGGTSANPGFRVQVLQIPPNRKSGNRMSRTGVNDVNFGGSAKDPFLLRKPYRFRGGSSILIRVQNMQNSSNTIQVVLHGGQD